MCKDCKGKKIKKEKKKLSVEFDKGAPNNERYTKHGEGDEIINTWFHGNHQREWRWPRLSGDYHGSGCTLASAIAARLAQGLIMDAALDAAQNYTQHSLANAYAIAAGQLIPNRLKEMS